MGNKPIVHAPIATGSTEPRDIRDRFADFVNLKDFGAKGDGVTDDSSAWAAWNTALQNGGMPYIPKGNYLLGEDVVHAPKGYFGRNTQSFSYEDDGVVLNEFGASIYMDPNGDDTNDGLTPQTAIKTFSKAIEIARYIPHNYIQCNLATGTYTGNFFIPTYPEVYGKTFRLYCFGDVTISGNIRIDQAVLIVISRSSETNFVVNGRVSLFSKAQFRTGDNVIPQINYTTSENDDALHVDDSYVYFTQNASISCTSGYAVINATRSTFIAVRNLTLTANSITNYAGIFISSLVNLQGTTNISGTSCNGGLTFVRGSQAYIKNLYVSEIIQYNHSLDIGINSSVAFAGEGYLYSGINSGNCVSVYGASVFEKSGSTSSNCIFMVRNSGGGGIVAMQNSRASLWNKLAIDAHSANGQQGSGAWAIYAVDGSTISIFNPCSIAFYNTWNSAVISASGTSLIYIDSSAVLNGAPVGKRYGVTRCSAISVENGGANRIPGTIAGTTGTNGVYTY